MGQLPISRVTASRPFLETGVDFCGPFLLRQSRNRRACTIKAYVAVFVCMSTKALHLELVSDLSTDAFLASLNRFMARRGKCRTIYSDNGTNFHGANRALTECHAFLQKGANKDAIINTLLPEKITWSFIPPNAPHFGGLWESSVKSVKYHLLRTIGNTPLVFEEFYTILTSIEACLNSRPLTALSESPNDFTALTPSHFLIGESLVLPAELEQPQVPIDKLKRWKLVQAAQQHFWKRWSLDYLNQLQQHSKWPKSNPNLQLNDLVVVKEDNIPPTMWRLARIVEVHLGKDGVVRVATIKTASTILKRPVVKLCRLPNQE